MAAAVGRDGERVQTRVEELGGLGALRGEAEAGDLVLWVIDVVVDLFVKGGAVRVFGTHQHK